MDKKQQGCLVFVVALFIYLLLGWVVVKAGIQPVAEALGYELPTAATLILVFWVQALAAGNVWQGHARRILWGCRFVLLGLRFATRSGGSQDLECRNLTIFQKR